MELKDTSTPVDSNTDTWYVTKVIKDDLCTIRRYIPELLQMVEYKPYIEHLEDLRCHIERAIIAFDKCNPDSIITKTQKKFFQ